jgi:hypothetical protein
MGGKFRLSRIPLVVTNLREEVRFARDSPLEEAVLSELVSEGQIPC